MECGGICEVLCAVILILVFMDSRILWMESALRPIRCVEKFIGTRQNGEKGALFLGEENFCISGCGGTLSRGFTA